MIRSNSDGTTDLVYLGYARARIGCGHPGCTAYCDKPLFDDRIPFVGDGCPPDWVVRLPGDKHGAFIRCPYHADDDPDNPQTIRINA